MHLVICSWNTVILVWQITDFFLFPVDHSTFLAYFVFLVSPVATCSEAQLGPFQTSNIKSFTIVNDFQSLTIVTKLSILNISGFLACYTFRAVPLNKERKLSVHKTFRRPPGGLLNVSCKFDVRPVSKLLFFLTADSMRKL